LEAVTAQIQQRNNGAGRIEIQIEKKPNITINSKCYKRLVKLYFLRQPRFDLPGGVTYSADLLSIRQMA